MSRFFAVALTTKKMVEESKAVEVGVEQYNDVELPKRETGNAAGYDFKAAEETEIPSIWAGAAKIMGVKLRGMGIRTVQSIGFILMEKEIQKPEEQAKADELRLFQPYYIHTGIKACMMDDEVMKLYLRSSTPRKFGLLLANSVGVIDSDYFECEDNDGEIMFAVYNLFPFSVTINKGERIGQGVFSKFLKVDGDTATNKRTGGLGSSDENK